MDSIHPAGIEPPPKPSKFKSVLKMVTLITLVVIAAYIASIYSYDVQSRINRNHKYNLSIYSETVLDKLSLLE